MGLLYLKPNYVANRPLAPTQEVYLMTAATELALRRLSAYTHTTTQNVETLRRWLEDVTRAVNDLQRDLVNVAEPNLFINSAGTTTAGTQTSALTTGGALSVPTGCTDTMLINVNGVKRRLVLYPE